MDKRTLHLRKLAYRLIHEAGAYGKTEWEVSAASGVQRWSIQPRVSDLARARSIIDSGRTRMNPSGHQAIVWIATEHRKEAPCG